MITSLPSIQSVIKKACCLWQQGEVVAIPTETVYGLAADATQDMAVAKIFLIKGRPQFNPLILHVSNLDQLNIYAEPNDLLYKVAAAFWPGALTVILKRRSNTNLSHLVTAGLDTVAVRIPSHKIAQELLESYGVPLAAPSANKSNAISPTSAMDVSVCLGDIVPLIIDGGPATVGIESTILDLTSKVPTILRPGGITFEALSKELGPINYYENVDNVIKAPGMLKRHYAPSLPLRLNALEKLPNEGMLGFGSVDGDLNLSKVGSLQEAAANLFSMLRHLDNPSYLAIAVAPIPEYELGIAINDRLNRASFKEEI